MDPTRRHHWVFDLDGTLTLAVHDFAALRRELGLPADRPILEALAQRPEAEARRLTARLDALEAELVSATRAARGAAELLSALHARGCRLGVLTRNSRENALATLAHCGLDRHIEPDHVLGRDEARPKPDPDGIRRLLTAWEAAPASGVMIGDFRFDLEAGRAAGVATISLDREGRHPCAHLADLCIDELDQLLPLP